MAQRSWILLNPGPVNLSPAVREALLGPDLCHREPEFTQLQARVRRRLLGVYGLAPQDWSAVLVCGSGTAAVEAMLVALPAGARVLVIENGVYGERMRRICEVHGIAYEALHLEWGAAIPLEAVEDRLDTGRFDHVAVVHHETTTGRLNPLRALDVLCAARGVGLLVDAVSSFGAEALYFQALAACAATANKCLHGVAGLSFVVARRTWLQGACDPRSVYLDLAAYARAQEAGDNPFTMPPQIHYALDVALEELERDGGWPARHARYRTLAERVRQGLAALGVAPLLAEGERSVVLRAYRLPERLSYERLHDALKAEGFVIYAGQGGLAKRIFRISTMGEIGLDDVERLLDAFGRVLAMPRSTRR